ncbi:MAG: hypothetical protein J0H14_12345 [Alphaproteobacteria bacterium]|nr:hypothetical protein [Alphaproteobacteria bacterium]
MTITASGAVAVSGVDASGVGVDAIDGPLPPSPQLPVVWTIRNAGAVSSTNGFGMSLASAGTVTNSGAISGVDGVVLNAGGTVVNNSGGSIAGTGGIGAGFRVGSGVYIRGIAGRVTNNGAISGGAYAVALGAGGIVTNNGLITGGEDGIEVQGALGTVVNNSTIVATVDDGVALFFGGTVTNGTGALISGAGANGAGIFITGSSGVVTNRGTIQSGGTNLGILMTAGGSINNATYGAISGGKAGIFFSNMPGTLTNSGSVSAAIAGVDMEGGGSVNNRLGGFITGGQHGVFIAGGAGAVVNSGSISSYGDINGKVYGAVALADGGSVTNNAGGTISGGTIGVDIGSRGIGTVTNSGMITALGASAAGVSVGGGGRIVNRVGGVISAASAGVFASGSPATVSNSGSIAGDHAVELEAGGSITNGLGASIVGGTSGVFVNGGAANLINNGNITATSTGIDIEAGGSVSNNVAGTISGGSFGIFLTGGGGVTNSGAISSTGSFGVDLAAGGNVTNAVGGQISAAGIGVAVYGGSGTVTNSGTISGGFNAVRFGGSGPNRVVVKPSAVFLGSVVSTSTTGNTMEFAGGTGTITGATGNSGTVTENGNSWAYSNFDTIAVDKGGSWTFSGTNTVQTVLNNGTIGVNGTLAIATSIDPASAGIFQLTSGSLEVAAAIGSTSKMQFLAPSELIVDDFTQFGTNIGTSSAAGPQLQSFGLGDIVDLKQFSSAGAFGNYHSGLLTIQNTAGQVASLSFQNSSLGVIPGQGQFQFATDGGTGVLITHT